MAPDIPIARLEYFRKEIGLSETKLSALRPFAAKLAGRADAAGRYLNALFRKVAPRTSLELALEYSGGALKDFWTRWYATLWTRPWDQDFLAELWRQGAASARMGIDLQYVMLGEVKCRQIFLRTVKDVMPMETRGAVSSAVNDLLDLCLIVRAKGHVSHVSHCALPLLQGIFHQTRNPLTVIGGTALRLMRQCGPEQNEQIKIILDETMRLERMTHDISTLNAIELSEPPLKPVAIGPLLTETLDGLRNGPAWPEKLETVLTLDPERPEVEADRPLLSELFKEVFVNALEAMPASGRRIEVTSRVDEASPSHLTIAILGPGRLPANEDMDQLFLPFHSTKPQGTGFGLAIAQAAARKCMGRVSLAQTPDGVVCTVKLPLKRRTGAEGFRTQLDF